MHLPTQQRVSLNGAIPHKRILVVCRQINRKHDIPVCWRSQWIYCVRRACTFLQTPVVCPLTALHLHLCHTVCLLFPFCRRPFSSESVSGPSCPAGDNHLAASAVFRISFLVTPKKDITNIHISISNLSQPRPAPRVRRSGAA